MFWLKAYQEHEWSLAEHNEVGVAEFSEFGHAKPEWEKGKG
jgi:hypothetical protein